MIIACRVRTKIDFVLDFNENFYFVLCTSGFRSPELHKTLLETRTSAHDVLSISVLPLVDNKHLVQVRTLKIDTEIHHGYGTCGTVMVLYDFISVSYILFRLSISISTK